MRTTCDERCRRVSTSPGTCPRSVKGRGGVSRGLVYLDVAHDDVYGLGATLASRVSGLAPPGSVVVSEAIAPLVRNYFELEFRPAQPVKGVDEPVEHYQ